jgi:hypothetical protein
MEKLSFNTITIMLFVLTFSACATSKYNDRDKTNPAYYEGTGIAVTDSAGVTGIDKNPNQLPPPDRGSKGATEGLVESAVSLATYPDYYKASTIRGTCIISSDELTFVSVPARHLHIALLDSGEKVVGQSETNDSGQFAFYVKRDKIYFIRILDQGYRLLGDKKPLTMGSEVTFRLIKKST